ncbi:MAG: hypothetical protein GY715_01765 [Planctomycetes bacterium]|nr:hypothetical protein [Planctomycetota bacterium]
MSGLNLQQLIHELRAVRTRFGTRAASRRRDLLKAGAQLRLNDSRRLGIYHDLLLFAVAHPDDEDVRERAEAELERVAAAATDLTARDRGGEHLDDSGLAGSVVECAYTLATIEWLLSRFPEDVEIAWTDESAGQGLDEFLPVCCEPVERDGVLSSRVSTQEWFELSRGSHRRGDLAWLVEQLRRLACPAPVLDQVVETLDMRVRWTLRGPRTSTTFLRFPDRPIEHQVRSLRRSYVFRPLLAMPLPAVRRLAASPAERLIDTARATLAIRHRETDPVCYADPRDVTLVSLERGVDVALFGMQPDRRLPIETFVGYLAAKNRVPAAYGGAWIFDDRAEIGINVFDVVRGGESAQLFGNIMRVYHRHFNVQRFLVDPYQFGADNEEGIRTGAIWFYYRMGFRPVDPELRALARAEWAKRRADARYRAPAAVLKRLTGSKLVLDVQPRRRGASGAPDLADVSLAATQFIGERFDGDRQAARRWSRRRLAGIAGATGRGRWPAPERDAFDRLGLLAAMVPDLAHWPADDQRALVGLLRAKGGPRERDYALRVQRHARLRAALHDLAAAVV